MKTLKLKSWVEFKLNIWEFLTVLELRKIYPIFKQYANNEVEMMVKLVESLSDEKDVESKMNLLSVEEFWELSNLVAPIISDVEQKKK